MSWLKLIFELITGIFKTLNNKKQAEVSLAQAVETSAVNDIIANTNITTNQQLMKTQIMLEEIQTKHKQENENDQKSDSNDNPFDQSW